MGGGREIPAFISTPAIVGIGTIIVNVKNIDTNNNFFILTASLFQFHPETALSALAALKGYLFMIAIPHDHRAHIHVIVIKSP
jgi:hypothetical protein